MIRLQILAYYAACAAGGVSAVFALGWFIRRHERRIEARRQAGELPANDNPRPTPAERQRRRAAYRGL